MKADIQGEETQKKRKGKRRLEKQRTQKKRIRKTLKIGFWNIPGLYNKNKQFWDYKILTL